MGKKLTDAEFMAMVDEEKAHLEKKEARMIKIQKVLTPIWATLVGSGFIVFIFLDKKVGMNLFFVSILPAFLSLVIGDYLLGKAEGRLEGIIISKKLKKGEE